MYMFVYVEEMFMYYLFSLVMLVIHNGIAGF